MTGRSTLQVVGEARYGGATLIMLAWSAVLRRRGWSVDVVCTDERMQAEVAALDGVGLVDSITIPKAIAPGTDLRALRRLWQTMRVGRYDVVHTYTATPSFLGRLAATAARVPVVVNHQGGWAVNETSSRAERALYTPLEYVANLLCTRNICVSHAERAKARAFHLAPARKLTTIVNGIDPAPLVPARDPAVRAAARVRFGFDDDAVVVGTTGRLVAGKGNRDVIDAMARLRLERPDLPVRLALAGDGDDRAELARLVAEQRLGDRVEFLGFVSDVPDFLAAIDIFVTPTLTEGLSMALLEALVSETPVIATAIAPNAEVVGDGETGLLVDVAAPDQIATAITRLAVDRRLAADLAIAGRHLVEREYSMQRMFDQTWELYHTLLEVAERSGRHRPRRRRAAAVTSGGGS